MAAQMSMLETCSKELSRGKSWSRCIYRLSPEICTLISASRYMTWEGPRSSSSSIPRDPHTITRGPICHPLPLLAAACQWISALQTRAPNLVERGYNATTAKGLATSHMSAHSHAGPSNNSRPGLHSNKEAIPMTRE